MKLLVLAVADSRLELDDGTYIGEETNPFLLEYTCNGQGVPGEGFSSIILGESFGIADGRKDDSVTTLGFG